MSLSVQRLILSKEVYDKIINNYIMIENSSGWCSIHADCGGQLKALQINKEYDFICSACDTKIKDNEKENIISFTNKQDSKLPENINCIDILQLDRDDRANLINPQTEQENKKQKEMIKSRLDDKPVFF